MPKQFDQELTKLKKKVVDMAGLAQQMFKTAMKALVERDADLMKDIASLEERVDRYQVEIDDDVVRLMATFGPVAIDLRFVLMVTRINTELERIGDQAVNMCEYVELLLAEPELKRLVDLPRMAETASEMIGTAVAAFNEGSSSQARGVIGMDDEVDALNDQIFRELLTYMISDAKNITRSVALILIARSLERIADHATNVAEEVIYLVKGEDVRHPEARHAEEQSS